MTRDGAVQPDDLSRAVAQSIAALLRIRLADPAQTSTRVQDRTIASSFELGQLIGDFLRIRDPDERRNCLALIRSRSTKI